eukprot:4373776-Pyramimonas_sp.AAC.1
MGGGERGGEDRLLPRLLPWRQRAKTRGPPCTSGSARVAPYGPPRARARAGLHCRSSAPRSSI